MIQLIPPIVVALLLLPLWRREKFAAFFLVLLLTEFLYVGVGGGSARVYHFIALALTALHVRDLPRLFGSGTLRILVAFLFINVVAVIMADDPGRAVASFGALFANACIALTTAILLITGRVRLATFRRMILGITLLSVGWSLVQILAYRAGGWVLALSEPQVAQIQSGFGPAFRTEANTFGKYMVVPFMLFLPEYVERRGIKWLGRAYVVFAVGILVNFTRSAIYAMGAVAPLVVATYAWRGSGLRLLKKSLPLLLLVVAAVAGVLSGQFSFSEYGAHKMVNFFNREELLEGGSSSFRLEMMRAVVGDVFSSTKKVLIGNGWGQSWLEIRGMEVQAGAGHTMMAWAYAGVLGAVFYIALMWKAWAEARRAAEGDPDEEVRTLAGGAVFAVIAAFLIGELSGGIASPEFWLLIGVAIALGARKRAIKVPWGARGRVGTQGAIAPRQVGPS